MELAVKDPQVVILIIAITILFDALLKKEKKKLQAEFEKRLNEEKIKILGEFYYEDGRRIEGPKKKGR